MPPYPAPYGYNAWGQPIQVPQNIELQGAWGGKAPPPPTFQQQKIQQGVNIPIQPQMQQKIQQSQQNMNAKKEQSKSNQTQKKQSQTLQSKQKQQQNAQIPEQKKQSEKPEDKKKKKKKMIKKKDPEIKEESKLGQQTSQNNQSSKLSANSQVFVPKNFQIPPTGMPTAPPQMLMQAPTMPMQNPQIGQIPMMQAPIPGQMPGQMGPILPPGQMGQYVPIQPPTPGQPPIISMQAGMPQFPQPQNNNFIPPVNFYPGNFPPPGNQFEENKFMGFTPPPSSFMQNTEPEEDSDEEEDICEHFLSGNCMFGNKCKKKHVVMGDEVDLVGDFDCGICIQKIKSNNKMFGLLPNCEHIFCLDCIRQWRGQLNAPKGVVRSCPLCRAESYIVIPSTNYIQDYQTKQKMFNDYKNNLSARPCKHFNFGESECPFGSSCLYEHKYKDGRKWEPPPLTKIVDADGNVSVAKSTKLSDFLIEQDPFF